MPIRNNIQKMEAYFAKTARKNDSANRNRKSRAKPGAKKLKYNYIMGRWEPRMVERGE